MNNETQSDYAWCFRLDGVVGRHAYAAFGFGLAFLKYVAEATVIETFTGKFYTPLDFLSPLLSTRATFTEGAPQWLGIGLVLWTVPFVWVAVAMSVRRCRDAGCSPWFALLILVPAVNYLTMLVLAGLYSKNCPASEYDQQEAELTELFQPPTVDTTPEPAFENREASSGVLAAIAGGGAGAAYAMASTLLTIYVLGNYGSALFFGTPIVAGAVSGFMFNNPVRRTLGMTLLQSTAMIFGCCCGFLLVGLEGAICIFMAMPIMVPLAVMGAVIGQSIAVGTSRPKREANRMLWCLAGLPLLASVESVVTPEPTYAVKSTIDIQATPQEVWHQVIAFPEITEQPAWFFRMGIASPLRAHIDGSGIGAIRTCEFTTGTFVEPITVWDENRRLAFDVSEQPHPMFELTPYRHIHPPHLDTSFRSTRGEFLLEPLPDGGTRLTGTTWYVLAMHPQAYWTLWSDELIHRIHMRVLEHIRRVAEAE